MNKNSLNIRATTRQDRLAVLLPGLGAVSSTLIAGVEAVKRNLALPIGSYTQMGRLQLDGQPPKPVSGLFPIASLDQLVFGGWDIFPENCYDTAFKNNIIDKSLLIQLYEAMSGINPMPAVFDQKYVPRLNPKIAKIAKTKMDYVDMLRKDISEFIRNKKCTRAVMLWCASTETYNPVSEIHKNLKVFEKGLKENDPSITPTQIYAYAALCENVPFINGSPNISVEVPAIGEFSELQGVPIAGSDFKTGQTLLKTVLAPGLRKRLLGVSGWYSSNILGNRDGEVLDDPSAFRSKEITKTNVLNNIFSAEEYPELYSNLHHLVKINYYPPRGDNKESWDNIDIFGWLGYQMQIKVNFLAKDSILAAPIALDLILLADLAARSGLTGIQSWLGYYFKSPHVCKGELVEHDLNIQFSGFEAVLKEIHKSGKATEKILVND